MGRTRNQGSNWCRKSKRLAIYLRDGHRCAYCGRHSDELKGALTLDHVLACELGGTNAASNLVACCGRCNSRKGALSVRSWFATLRSEGCETQRIGRRVRRQTRKDLAPWLAMARLSIRSGRR